MLISTAIGVPVLHSLSPHRRLMILRTYLCAAPPWKPPSECLDFVAIVSACAHLRTSLRIWISLPLSTRACLPPPLPPCSPNMWLAIHSETVPGRGTCALDHEFPRKTQSTIPCCWDRLLFLHLRVLCSVSYNASPFPVPNHQLHNKDVR